MLLVCMSAALAVMVSVSKSQPGSSVGLPDGYWAFPLAPQGTPPARWSRAEQSLKPEDCGTCHVAQYDEWRTSLHARAFSPGLLGQLLSTDDRGEIEACMNCHAPLFEQKRRFFAALDGDRVAAAELV